MTGASKKGGERSPRRLPEYTVLVLQVISVLK